MRQPYPVSPNCDRDITRFANLFFPPRCTPTYLSRVARNFVKSVSQPEKKKLAVNREIVGVRRIREADHDRDINRAVLGVCAHGNRWVKPQPITWSVYLVAEHRETLLVHRHPSRRFFIFFHDSTRSPSRSRTRDRSATKQRSDGSRLTTRRDATRSPFEKKKEIGASCGRTEQQVLSIDKSLWLSSIGARTFFNQTSQISGLLCQKIGPTEMELVVANFLRSASRRSRSGVNGID